MRNTLGLSVAVALMLVALGACGGDDADPQDTDDAADTSTPAGGTSPAESPADSDDTDEPASSGSSGTAGSVVVDGTEFGINEVRRCEPFFGGEDDLDLQGLGDGVIVFAVINHPISGSPFVSHELSIQGNNAGGAFAGVGNAMDGENWTFGEEGPSLPGAPFEVDGGRITGSPELFDVRESGETRTVSFDMEVPEDVIDC